MSPGVLICAPASGNELQKDNEALDLVFFMPVMHINIMGAISILKFSFCFYVEEISTNKYVKSKYKEYMKSKLLRVFFSPVYSRVIIVSDVLIDISQRTLFLCR